MAFILLVYVLWLVTQGLSLTFKSGLVSKISVVCQAMPELTLKTFEVRSKAYIIHLSYILLFSLLLCSW